MTVGHVMCEYMRDAERRCNFADIDVLVTKSEARRSRRDLQIGNLRQHVQQRLGQAIREVFVVTIGRHIGKWQHRN